MQGHVVVLCLATQAETPEAAQEVASEAQRAALSQGAELTGDAPIVRASGFVSVNGEAIDLDEAGLVAMTFTMERV